MMAMHEAIPLGQETFAAGLLGVEKRAWPAALARVAGRCTRSDSSTKELYCALLRQARPTPAPISRDGGDDGLVMLRLTAWVGTG